MPATAPNWLLNPRPTLNLVFSSSNLQFAASRSHETFPGLVYRDRRMVRDGNDNINLAVSFEHDLNLSQWGHEICLGRNEATIMQADAPGTAGTRRQFKVLEISISQREWRMRSAHPSDAFMKVINRHSESLKLLVGYVGVLAKAGLPALLKHATRSIAISSIWPCSP